MSCAHDDVAWTESFSKLASTSFPPRSLLTAAGFLMRVMGRTRGQHHLAFAIRITEEV
jgi:hypothetical protein